MVFVTFIPNLPVQIPIIFQDTTSVISLVTKGGGVMCPKYLRVRVHWCNEGMDQKWIKIVYGVPTKRMIANRCTKALEKRDFEIFLNCLPEGI